MKDRGFMALAAILIAIPLIFLAGITIHRTEKEKMNIKDFHTKLLGENVFLFRESDDHSQIQKIIDSVYGKQETNQFGEERYAFCFFPGNYEDITVNVGFYTQVLGLGLMPTDVKIGKINCSATWLGDDHNHNATQNFWRSVENVEILSNTMWAVSQATDMRRVQIDGSLHLHDNFGWASGGFLSDSRILAMIDSGSQQQWLSRNNQYHTWMNENWNMVFVGDEPSGLPTGTWPLLAYTTVSEAPTIQDKPLLLWPDPESKEGPGIMVPARRNNAVGISWADAGEVDYDSVGWDVDKIREYADSISPETKTRFSDFPSELGTIGKMTGWYIAFPDEDTAVTINEALKKGKNILFTPGVYELDEPIVADQNDRILLGLGLASLKAVAGNVCIETKGDNIMLCGLLFDAGPALKDIGGAVHVSENLLHIGHGENVVLNDLYFRVGGTPTDKPAEAKRCITIDADNVIGDNLWVWRADHGDQVAWDKNKTENGIVINGNNVTMYALMVEHFHEYQTVWNGEGGSLYMYQSEIPYDVTSQEVWMSRDGKRHGYASIFVNDDVKDFHGEGIGIYLYNRDVPVLLESAIELPDRKGVSLHHVITVMLTGNPGMKHVVNNAGASVMTPGAEAIILDYENGEFR